MAFGKGKKDIIKSGGFIISQADNDRIVFTSQELGRVFGHEWIGKSIEEFFNIKDPSFLLGHYMPDTANAYSWQPLSPEGYLKGCTVLSEKMDIGEDKYILSQVYALDNKRNIFKDPGNSLRSTSEKEALPEVIYEFGETSNDYIKKIQQTLKILKETFQMEDAFYLISNESSTMIIQGDEEEAPFGEALQESLSAFSTKVRLHLGEEINNSFQGPAFTEFVLADMDIQSEAYQFLYDKKTYLMTLHFPGDDRSYGNLFIINPDVHITADGFVKLATNIIVFSYMFSKSYKLSQQIGTVNNDPLTGIKNANAYAETKRLLTENKPEHLGVVFIDVNGLKYTNDHYGHVAGDSLIVGTVNIILKHYPKADCYRVGGDEFIALTTDQNELDFMNTVSDIKGEFATDQTTSASVGFAFGEGKKAIIASLVDKADKDMYLRKDEFYKDIKANPEKNDLIFIRTLKDEVKAAVDKQTFSAKLSPRFSEPEHHVIAFDAVVYLKEKIAGITEPKQFIHEMESIGAGPLAALTLFEVCCRMQRQLIDKYDKTVPIYVNFGASSLKDPKLTDKLASLADKYSLPHQVLGLSLIHVGTFGENDAIEFGKKAHEAGFMLSLNRFGFGSASLYLLNSIDFDSVKLSGNYVSSLDNEDGYKVLTGLLGLCRSLNVPIVFDHIKTKEQYEKAIEYGFTYMRGSYLQEPMSLSETEESYYEPSQDKEIFDPSSALIIKEEE